MWTVRVARAFTDRPKIVKAYGGYHGSYDQVDQWAWGSAQSPRLLHDYSDHVITVPYNDLPALREAVGEGAEDEVAAVILEPVLGSGGIFSASDEYLRGVRAFCDEVGALMILDEVITLRLSRGGAQELSGVVPDLTVLGKVIGGGFPVGAFGGRDDVMALLDPNRSDALSHSGTYNGNPVTMTAGIAILELLDDDAFVRLNTLGAALESRIRAAAAARDLPLTTTRAGSLLQIHDRLDPRPPVSGERRDPTVSRALHLALAIEGVHLAPRGFLNCSLAHTDDDIAEAGEAFDRALGRVEELFSH